MEPDGRREQDEWEPAGDADDLLRAVVDDALAGADRTPFGWVTLAEAEEEAGISRSSLRAWYRAGKIPSRLVPGPYGVQRLVPLDAVLQTVRRSPRLGHLAVTERRQRRSAAAVPTVGDGDDRRSEAAAAALLAEARQRADDALERARAAETRADRLERDLLEAVDRAARAEAALASVRSR